MEQQNTRATRCSCFTVHRRKNLRVETLLRGNIPQQHFSQSRKSGMKVKAANGQNAKGPFGRKDDKKEVCSKAHG